MAAQYNVRNNKDICQGNGTSVVLNLRNNAVCKGNGTTPLVNVRNTSICKGNSSNVLLNVRGNDICQGTGSNKVGKVNGDAVVINGHGVEVKGLSQFSPPICAAVAVALLNPL